MHKKHITQLYELQHELISSIGWCTFLHGFVRAATKAHLFQIAFKDQRMQSQEWLDCVRQVEEDPEAVDGPGPRGLGLLS